MISVSPLAVEKLKEILVEENAPDSALRILVVPSGHGVQYMLTLEKEPRQDDLTFEAEGLKIVVDNESAPVLEGANIDYIDDLMRSGFVVSNPNVPMGEGCACGGQCSCGGHGQHEE
ncbi:MAG: iron-sulfur cluster assembly accessory protein [Chloroflexi bacterium]|nr:iron-sulfur cluster assembly accessory protein [Chloroflexota bacterium]